MACIPENIENGDVQNCNGIINSSDSVFMRNRREDQEFDETIKKLIEKQGSNDEKQQRDLIKLMMERFHWPHPILYRTDARELVKGYLLDYGINKVGWKQIFQSMEEKINDENRNRLKDMVVLALRHSNWMLLKASRLDNRIWHFSWKTPDGKKELFEYLSLFDVSHVGKDVILIILEYCEVYLRKNESDHCNKLMNYSSCIEVDCLNALHVSFRAANFSLLSNDELNLRLLGVSELLEWRMEMAKLLMTNLTFQDVSSVDSHDLGLVVVKDLQLTGIAKMTAEEKEPWKASPTTPEYYPLTPKRKQKNIQRKRSPQDETTHDQIKQNRKRHRVSKPR